MMYTYRWHHATNLANARGIQPDERGCREIYDPSLFGTWQVCTDGQVGFLPDIVRMRLDEMKEHQP